MAKDASKEEAKVAVKGEKGEKGEKEEQYSVVKQDVRMNNRVIDLRVPAN